MLRRRAEHFLFFYSCVVLGFQKSLVFSESKDGLTGKDSYLGGIPKHIALQSEKDVIVDQEDQDKEDVPQRVKRDTSQFSLPCDSFHTEFVRFRKSLKEELIEPITEKIAEIKGLKDKVEVLRSKIKMQQKSIRLGSETIEGLDKKNKRLQSTIDRGICQEENIELAWLKARFLKDSDWNTELHLAAYQKDEEEVKKLVANGAYINARNKNARTPLILAPFGANEIASLQIIKFLIDNGADVYAKDDVGLTFLHMLVPTGTNLSPSAFHDIAEYLISKNMSALFNLPGWSDGGTPLAGAVCNVDVESRTLKLLHDNQVDFEVVDNNGSSLLAYAIWEKRSSTFLDNLIKLGVNYQRLTILNENVLHLAAATCYVQGVKFYLGRRYFDVNARNSFGNTPLHRSVRNCKENPFEIVGALIEHGANVKIKNMVGKTPLDIAMEEEGLHEKDKVIKLLRDNE